MKTIILSKAVPIKTDKGAGSFEMHRVTSAKGYHYCFAWSFEIFESHYLHLPEKRIKSPIFTVPKKNECKWCLIVNHKSPEDDRYETSVHLVLDPKSDCEKVSVKLKVWTLDFRYDFDQPQNRYNWCSLESARNFEFNRNLNNTVDTLSSRATTIYSTLSKSQGKTTYSIICNITIEEVILEDDSISNDFGILYKNQLFTDYVIKVNEKNYPVHKGILASRSSVFAAMFAHDMIENKGSVVINDADADVMEEMLLYIYTGKVKRLDLARDLLVVADKYDLKKLRTKCAQYLSSTLSKSNAFELLLFAKSYNADVLKSAAIEFITNRYNMVVKTSAWETLCQSDPELLRELCEAFLLDKINE